MHVDESHPRKLALHPCPIHASWCQSEARALAMRRGMFSRFLFRNNQGQGHHMALAALGDDIIGLVVLAGLYKHLMWPEDRYIFT